MNFKFVDNSKNFTFEKQDTKEKITIIYEQQEETVCTDMKKKSEEIFTLLTCVVTKWLTTVFFSTVQRFWVGHKKFFLVVFVLVHTNNKNI